VHVAIISARTVRDVAARARVGGIDYLGDHGVEHARAARGFRVSTLRVTFEPAPGGAARIARALAREVPRRIPDAWLVVERKSSSVAFHFRTAPDVAAAAARVRGVVDAVDADARLVRHAGPRSLELRPTSASSKARALRRLLDDVRPAAAIMLGDDRHDAAAFRVLREARGSGHLSALSVAVAAHPDVTREVAPEADLLLASPAHVARFLRGLADLP
jgi:trehalose 6-phosphate phosphatase